MMFVDFKTGCKTILRQHGKGRKDALIPEL